MQSTSLWLSVQMGAEESNVSESSSDVPGMLSSMPKIPENCGWISIGMVRFGFVQLEYLGTPLEEGHLFWSEYSIFLLFCKFICLFVGFL